MIRRLEPTHLSLPLAGPLVGDLGSIVGVSVSAVAGLGQNRSNGRRIASQPIAHEQPRCSALTFQRLLQESFSSLRVPSTLDQNVDDIAILVYSSPEVVNLPANRDEDFVDVPGIAKSPFTTLEASTIQRSELQAPASDGLVGNRDASFGEQILDIREAQAEATIQPDGMTDDLGREAVSALSTLTSHCARMTKGGLM